MSLEDHATRIQDCIDRMGSGDSSARDELLARAADRLTRLTRKMLRDFPGVHRWEETGDVLQNAALRLCRALDVGQPPTTADFFRLAAVQIRRELLDLARRYSGSHGLGTLHACAAREGPHGDTSAGDFHPSDTTYDPHGLAAWTDFHRAAEALPMEAREVFDLLFYQGLSQAEAATVLDVSERTIKRRWQAARLRLVDVLGGKMPGL